MTIFGLRVVDGDLIHADRHGALVIPPNYVSALGPAIAKLLETERIVLDAARSDGFNFESFEAAWQDFEKART